MIKVADMPSIERKMNPGAVSHFRTARIHSFYLHLKLVKACEIVTVHELDEPAGGYGQAGVAGGTRAAIGLLDQPHAPAEGFDDRDGIIRGAIVHNDDLLGRERLPQHVLDGLSDQGGAIVTGDDDGNLR